MLFRSHTDTRTHTDTHICVAMCVVSLCASSDKSHCYQMSLTQKKETKYSTKKTVDDCGAHGRSVCEPSARLSVCLCVCVCVCVGVRGTASAHSCPSACVWGGEGRGGEVLLLLRSRTAPAEMGQAGRRDVGCSPPS